ncbi:MAG: glycoside hydrolase family 125 protein [Hydrogeniiclostridium mannosilyticum]
MRKFIACLRWSRIWHSSYFPPDCCPHSDTLPGGDGAPVNVTGMTWSGFRPSDDTCKFGYLIPPI